MLAFLGAIICIIAAVHPALTAAAPPDNRSARPGALHGAAAATRLLCSPVPAEACAAEPSPLRADWAAAERLREAALRQEEEIRADQRTIRELSDKLAECERAHGGGGPWGGSRVMAGDGTPAGPAVHELERAVVQLRDRMERLEMEVHPSGQNHSGPSDKGQGAQREWGKVMQGQVKDLEEKLQRKMKQLEKERAMQHKETGSHRDEMNQGINSLQQRLEQLEEGLSKEEYPEGFKVSFPLRTNYMYAVVKHQIPEMYALTACLWLKAKAGGIGTPFSYSVPGQPNELVLLQGVHNPVELLINDKVAQLPLTLTLNSWHHVCVSWSLRDGVWQAYQDGQQKGEGEGLAAWHPIRPDGMLVLGQEQDTLGGRFDASQALVGELSQFNLWDRVLAPGEISSLAGCGTEEVQGKVASWNERDVEVVGGAAKEPLEPCEERVASQ